MVKETYELEDSELVNSNHCCANALNMNSTATTNGTFSDGLNGIAYKTNGCTTIPNNLGSDEEINTIDCNSPHCVLVHKKRPGYADSCRKDNVLQFPMQIKKPSDSKRYLWRRKKTISLKDMTCNKKSRPTFNR